VIAQAQKAGGVAAFIDAEHALDPAYARKLGVNIDELLVSQPDNGEEALEIAETLIKSNASTSSCSTRSRPDPQGGTRRRDGRRAMGAARRG
jgi:RecA/RadA recombinase